LPDSALFFVGWLMQAREPLRIIAYRLQAHEEKELSLYAIASASNDPLTGHLAVSQWTASTH